MRVLTIAVLLSLGVLPALAQGSPPVPASKSPAVTQPQQAPAAKSETEAQAADRASAQATKASRALEAKIQASDRKMERAMNGICIGCLDKTKAKGKSKRHRNKSPRA